MNSKLIPFIRIDNGKCKEAMEFYKSIFGGKLTIMTAKDTPMAKDTPDDKKDYVMHALLDAGAVRFAGSDMFRDKLKVGDNVGMMLDCPSTKELDTIFNSLAEGGEVFMKPENTFWGAYFGVVTDKYGIEWMLNCTLKK